MADWDYFANEGEIVEGAPTGSYAYYDSSHTRTSLIYPSGSRITFPAPDSEIYVHFRCGTQNTSNNAFGALIYLYDASNTLVAGVQGAPNLDQIRAFGKVGGVTTYTAAVTCNHELVNSPRIKLKVDTVNGSLALMISDVEVATLAIDANSVDMSHAIIYDAITTTSYSTLAFTTRNRSLSKYYSKYPTADGTDVDGTGSYTGIDESVLSTVDSCVMDAAGQRRSVLSNAPTMIDLSITAFAVSCFAAKEDETGPQNIRPYIKIAGTRYYGSVFPLSTTLKGFQYVFENNPATSSEWTTATLNDSALEYGWEAVA